VCPLHQQQHPSFMEHDDYASPCDIVIHQASNRLKEGVYLCLLRSRRPVALVHRCRVKVEAGVWGQGRVGITSKVEPLLVPPLVGSHPLHGDVFIRLALAQLDRAAADEHQRRLTPPNHSHKNSGSTGSRDGVEGRGSTLDKNMVRRGYTLAIREPNIWYMNPKHMGR
jgi:hypothetical protein